MSQMSSMSNSLAAKKISGAVMLASLLTLVLYLVPFLHPLAYPFTLLSTLVHELSHGLVAILMGGNFESLKIWADGSGVASIEGPIYGIPRALVALAGLLGPAVVSALCFLVVKFQSRTRFMLATMGILFVLSIMLVVRNLFGVFFVSVTSALCFYFSLGNGKKYCQEAMAFFAIQLALSVFSRSDYLFTKTALTSMGNMPSDVAQIADALFLPYWFWGIFCAVFSVAVLVFGIRRIFK